MKKTRQWAHLKVAKAYAELSTCEKMKVGALITKDDRPIAVGYNGTISGADNNCEVKLVDGSLMTLPTVVHAEMNAIAFAARSGVSTFGCSMILTHTPCENCAKLILQAGIEEVYYGKLHKVDGLQILDRYIKVKEIL